MFVFADNITTGGARGGVCGERPVACSGESHRPIDVLYNIADADSGSTRHDRHKSATILTSPWLLDAVSRLSTAHIRYSLVSVVSQFDKMLFELVS